MSALDDVPLEVALDTPEPDVGDAAPGASGLAALATLERRETPFMVGRREATDQGPPFDPIVLASGRGSTLTDVDGHRYVDLVAGFGAVLLGHGSPVLRAAIHGQADRLIQGMGDVYASDVKIALLERLARLHPDPEARVILAQSGGDALTAAIKTSQLWSGRPGLLAWTGAYHGLGHGPLAACGLRHSYRSPFADQLNPHVTFAPYPASREALDRSLDAARIALQSGAIGAVLVEPILGRAGCLPAPAGFLPALATMAREHGALLVADEVWTGLGRSGALVRSLAEGVIPDLVCFGKGLGGGLSISACVGKGDVLRSWARDEEVVHTSTHAGAPLACAAALAVLGAVDEHRLVERSAALGSVAIDALSARLAEHIPGRAAVRGEGLMIGVELESAEIARAVLALMRRRGYLLLGGGTRHEVITWTPALTIPRSTLLRAVEVFAEVLGEVLGRGPR